MLPGNYFVCYNTFIPGLLCSAWKTSRYYFKIRALFPHLFCVEGIYKAAFSFLFHTLGLLDLWAV